MCGGGPTRQVAWTGPDDRRRVPYRLFTCAHEYDCRPACYARRPDSVALFPS